jgi:hypothetical protein
MPLMNPTPSSLPIHIHVNIETSTSHLRRKLFIPPHPHKRTHVVLTKPDQAAQPLGSG